MPRTIPQHVVIIPDGNRRWAEEKSLPANHGHMQGYERVSELIPEARALGIKYLTFWSFSTENWNRSKEEVDALLGIITQGLRELKKQYASAKNEDRGRFVHIGRKDRLNDEILTLIASLEEETKEYSDFCLCIAIDYGGEDELNRAEKRLRESGDTGKSLSDFLDTTLLQIPSPDLIIRTSGEYRTSGFMPLQSAYSEWYFDTALFPDFDKESFHKAIAVYSGRQRRFGK